MTLLDRLLAPWHWQQRRMDLMILWPACRREALARGLGMAEAKAAFAVHCFRDHPWLVLGEEEIKTRIDRLA